MLDALFICVLTVYYTAVPFANVTVIAGVSFWSFVTAIALHALAIAKISQTDYL